MTEDRNAELSNTDDLDDLDRMSRPAQDPALVSRMLDLVSTQNQLNSVFIGADWLVKAMLHAEIDYRVPIVDEFHELFGCNNSWKFWKKPVAPDLDNTRLEIVDILHFVLAEAIVVAAEDLANLQDQLATPEWIQENMGPILNEVAIAMQTGYQDLGVVGETPPYLTQNAGTYNPQGIKQASLSLLSGVCYTELDEVNDSYPLPSISWRAFFAIVWHAGISFDELYVTYKAKVALNKFRVGNGDKAGTYKRKWWDDQEDNYYLMMYAKNHVATSTEPLSEELLLQWLTSRYAAFQTNQPFTLL